MSELTNRIRKHNSWRRGEHDDMCNAMQLGNDLDALSNDLDKLTEQNKMLREALAVLHSNFSRWDNLSPMDKAALNSSLKVLGETKC